MGLALAMLGLGVAGDVCAGQGLLREGATPEYSPEVQEVLEKKLNLIKALAQEPTTVANIQENLLKNQQLTEREIQRLDKEWTEGREANGLVHQVLGNSCARHLWGFQEAHDEFSEIFVTDMRGLVVSSTNRTSDYNQADEAWWVEAFAEGRGRSYYGEIEYDESARSEAIALYVPVRDPESNRVIGVVKALCDLTAIMMEL